MKITSFIAAVSLAFTATASPVSTATEIHVSLPTVLNLPAQV